MADISMCLVEDCPKKNECYRYTAEANPYLQSYMDFKDTCMNNGYESFWPNKNYRGTQNG